MQTRKHGADVAMLSEAAGWLAALATSEAVADDKTRLYEQAVLATEADFHDVRADRVLLMTMHAAIGFKYSVMFVVGVEVGLVPFSFPDGKDGAEEERRLFFVVMIRAKDRLLLSRTAERFWRGERRALPPSPFLGKLKLLTRTRTGRQRRPQQYSLF
jgi:DNA helicase II / ATP-dependent DNA helicase PcrA